MKGFIMKMKTYTYSFLLVITVLACRSFSAEKIPAHQVRKIAEAAPAKAHVVPKKPRQVLIWITPPHLMEKDPHKGYCIPYATTAFETLWQKSGAFEPVVSGDLATYLPENIRQFGAIVMNNSSGPWITPTDADMAKKVFKKHGKKKAVVEQVLRRILLDYVSNGGGIMAIHFAIGANRHWPGFQQLLGATFTEHSWNEEVGITVEEPRHPLVGAFGGEDFRLVDEIYQYGDPYNRSKVHVLLSLDPERTNMGVKWIRREVNDFALTWVKSYGKGLVFYTSFGHRTELFWNPVFLKHLLAGIQFVIGDLNGQTAPIINN